MDVCARFAQLVKISDCQPEGSVFIPRPGRGLNFGRPSFSTPSVDRNVNVGLVSQRSIGGLKRTDTLVGNGPVSLLRMRKTYELRMKTHN